MTSNDPLKECDLLIIGGGGAGALAAVEASKHENLNIVLVSKGPIGKSGLTPTANGGTAFHSTPEGTLEEMVTAGCFLNDQSLVWLMAEEALKILEKLKGFGIESVPIRPVSRCILPSDLLPALRKIIIQSPNIELLEDVLITRLLMKDGHIAGATALNLATGEFFTFKAKAVVVATGGLVGEMYPHTSNNPFGVTTDSSGTGHAMAYSAGAELMDLEMIQFVPLPGNARCRNLRYFPEFWDGPYLNRHGDVVEDDVSAYRGKSYSHQFVQKIVLEMEKGNGPIFVDRRDIPKKESAIKVRSWTLRRKLIDKLDIDPHDHRIEIIIGSHFGMGGIKVNEKTETSLPGLFAAGEVMGGVHGGLRLAGCSFTQMIVFGLLAGRHASLHALSQRAFNDLSKDDVDNEKERVFGFLEKKRDALSLAEIKGELQGIMADHVFVLRDRDGLEKAVADLGNLRQQIPRIAVPGFRRFNLEWARSIEFELMAQIAEVVAQSALVREESRGFHFRRDFPEQNNADWLKHVIVKQQNRQALFTTKPVSLEHLRPETSS